MPHLDLPPSLPVELAPFQFLAGRWSAPKTAEFWVPVGDAWFSVSFGPDGWYEVAKVALVDGRPTFVAQPSGGRPTPFPAAAIAEGDVTFVNPEHDSPGLIHYWRDGARLRAAIGPAEGAEQQVFRAKALPMEPVAALVEADRAFYAEVKARGVDAWVARFDPGGHQWDEEGDRAVTPTDGIRELIGPTLEGSLWWDPVASGLSRTGDLGFTIGSWTWTPPGGAEPAATGAYVTVWRRQADGTWRVWFDGGDPVDR